MNNETINLIKKTFNENINSHAFLMETNNIDLCLNDTIKMILELNNISREIILENIPDIKVIYPDGKDIKKEQISNIIEEFQTYPVELKHRYYIIVNSELMNQSSANVILKFLEEPDNTVIGFFITINRKSMINTIVSRCQSYKLLYNEFFQLDKEKIQKFITHLDCKEIYQRILFLNTFVSKDRVENINLFKEIKKYLLDNCENDAIKIKLLVKRVRLLDNVIERLMKNANQELVILDLARNWK